MSAPEILSTLDVLIKLGSEIQSRLASIPRAVEDLKMLDTQLRLFVSMFQNPENKDIPLMSEFLIIPRVLESIADLCTKCAKALDIDLVAGATNAANTANATSATITEPYGKKLVRRIRAFYIIPGVLAEIQRKADQLHKIYTTISSVILHSMATTHQGQTIVSQTAVQEKLLHLDVSTGSVNIDQMVGGLITECKHLRQRLQEAILLPDASSVQDYELLNPEGASFWRDRFHKDELDASAFRYESFYVSWARFVHAIETSFVLKRIPTAVFDTANIDIVRKQGSRYFLDHNGTRNLSDVRPLWLPALRSALDPLHKGYVKPRDYFSLLQDCSLSETLRSLTLQNAGYGIYVECERATGDLPLPTAIESSADHVGWTSAQIVAVPRPDELGIRFEEDMMASSGDALFSHFNDISQDVKVYVRYLQTGQIECKSLLKQVRPIGGVAIGAKLSIRHELKPGDHAWSCDLPITDFKARYGGEYIITVNGDRGAITFSTRLLKNSFDHMLVDDNNPLTSTIPELDCTLLGPSKAFSEPPKTGEKIQVEYDGFWYDSRVTLVDGDEVEYIDWNNSPKQDTTDAPRAQDDSERDETHSDSLFFSEEQLSQLGKGKRRLWQPWRRNVRRYDVRPYRCFHIGDTVEAPIMYPDFRLHYHVTDNSQLFLPCRIVDVQGDQYVVEFSPALSAHEWWLGKMPKATPIELVPGSGVKIENPLDFNRATVHMDRVRPFSAGPRPVLGLQSAKPSGWSSFQGVQFSSLERLMERSLWSSDGDGSTTGGTGV